jgi:hypothetical protein
MTFGPEGLIGHIPQRRTRCRKEQPATTQAESIAFAVARLFFHLLGLVLAGEDNCSKIQEQKLFAHLFLPV